MIAAMKGNGWMKQYNTVTCRCINRKINKFLLLHRNLSLYTLQLSHETHSLLYSSHKCESASLCFRDFWQQIIPSSWAKDEDKRSLFFAEESWRKAQILPSKLHRVWTKEQTLSPHFLPSFTVVWPHWPPYQTKASVEKKKTDPSPHEQNEI